MHRTQQEFEQKLREFFNRHDPAKRDLAPRIAAHFLNHQDEVFEHLSDLYHEKEGIHVDEESIFSIDVGPNYGAEPF